MLFPPSLHVRTNVWKLRVPRQEILAATLSRLRESDPELRAFRPVGRTLVKDNVKSQYLYVIFNLSHIKMFEKQ